MNPVRERVLAVNVFHIILKKENYRDVVFQMMLKKPGTGLLRISQNLLQPGKCSDHKKIPKLNNTSG